MPHAKKPTNERKKNRKLNKRIKVENVEFNSDENFAFNVEYTSNCASDGVTNEQMNEIEKENHKTEY